MVQPGARSVGPQGEVVRGLQQVMDRLLLEYSDVMAPGMVVSCVARCTRLASRTESPFLTLPTVVERLARTRLEASSVLASGAPETPQPGPADVQRVKATS